MKRYLLSLLCLSLPVPVLAQDQCEATRPLDGQRLLRRLSLDLRGKVPSLAEIEAQSGVAEVPSSQVDNFVDSEDFVRVMRRYHEALLWPNIDQAELVPGTHMLYPYELTPGVPIYMSPLRSVFLRTTGAGELYYPCKNEPAEFDAQGNLVLDALMVGTATVAWVEGYVEVEPYWAPGTRVKVCGLDALSAESAPVCPGPAERYPFIAPSCEQFAAFAAQVQAPFTNTPVDCSSRLAIFAPGCGCGPHLERCQTPDTYAEIKNSLLEQMLRIPERVIRDDLSYENVLTMADADFNGPIAHYLRWQSKLSFDLFTGPDATAPAPDVAYSAKAWVPVTRTGRHAGVLTTPGFLLKFMSNRARAHRFYNAFECSSFIPSGPLPSPAEPCSQRQDLSQRCGCNACHQALEPMAAHWGRFSEYGFLHLDEERYPARAGRNCTPPLASVEQLFECFRFYELDPVGEETAYRGYLNGYVFRTPEQVQDIEAGPSNLADDILQSGRFDACAVQKLWTHFMRREPTPEEETSVLPQLTANFAAGRSVRDLVKQIVAHPAYRRMP